MEYAILAIFDHGAKVYWTPYTASNLEVGKRPFITAANSPDSDIGKFPDQFSLFHIGHFDSDVGHVEPIVPNVSLGLASTYVRS